MSNKLYQQLLEKEDQNPINFVNETALFLSSSRIYSDQNKVSFENQKNIFQTLKTLKYNIDIFDKEYSKMFTRKKNLSTMQKIEGK